MTLPDGPNAAPVLQMLQWVFRPLEFMEKCDRRYGDAFTVRLGESARPLVFFSHPAAIQQIFTANPKAFDSGRANQVLRPLLGKKSLEMLDGKKHDRQRQLLMPPFHGERMRLYANLICKTTTQVAEQWMPGSAFRARTVMQHISFRLMCRILFDFDQGERFDQISHLFDQLFETATASPLNTTQLFFPALQRDFGAWSPWGNFMRQRQQLDQILYDEIHQRRLLSDPPRTDMLTLLMSAQDENGKRMTDEYLHSEIVTLLFAGHETIATAMAWAMYWIHAVPGVLDKIYHELDVLGSSPDPSEIVKLPYLSAVCQETLRIYPIGLITFPRILKLPMEIGGYELEKGTVITGCIYLTHRRLDLYPDPAQFKPERFLARQFAPHEYLPFGGGNRRCLGGAFAPYAMKLVIAQILSRWHLTLAEKRPVRPVRRGVTTAPDGGVLLRVKAPRQRQESVQTSSTSASCP